MEKNARNKKEYKGILSFGDKKKKVKLLKLYTSSDIGYEKKYKNKSLSKYNDAYND